MASLANSLGDQTRSNPLLLLCLLLLDPLSDESEKMPCIALLQLWYHPVVARDLLATLGCTTTAWLQQVAFLALPHGIIAAYLFAHANVAPRHHRDAPFHPDIGVA